MSLSDCLLFPFSLPPPLFLFAQGAVIGIDDEDDSTFTITVDQKTFHFQGEASPPVHSALLQPPSSPLCSHRSQSSSVNALHSAMLSICSLAPSLSPSCLLTSWIGLLCCQQTRTHWHRHNLKACCKRLSCFSLPLRALKLDWHISVNKICSTAS